MNCQKEFILIGAGLPRNGTLSTKKALEILLPGKCHHMMEAVNFPEEWIKILDGGMSDEEFKDFFLSNGYTCAVDTPFVFFYKRAMKIFPNAKVILNVRESKFWSQSILKTLSESEILYHTFPVNIFHWLGLFTRYLNLNPFATKFYQTDNMVLLLNAVRSNNGVEFYEKWNKEVKKFVPADKLLVFNVKEGWSPLCEFLSVPVPDQSFPNINDTRQFQQSLQHRYSRSWLLLYELVSLPLLIYAKIFYFGKN